MLTCPVGSQVAGAAAFAAARGDVAVELQGISCKGVSLLKCSGTRIRQGDQLVVAAIASAARMKLISTSPHPFLRANRCNVRGSGALCALATPLPPSAPRSCPTHRLLQ